MQGMSSIKPALILTAAAAVLAACATQHEVRAPAVAAQLNAPARQVLAGRLDAVGVQIYVCTATKADPARFEWAFKAPEADLFEPNGQRAGTHYAGPTWEGNDRSKVVGAVAARDDGPDGSAIPWLLLTAKSNAGSGVFGRTASIQRVDTVGGKAPAASCEAKQAGTEARVPYKAAYYFYDARS